jgi:hypothetical protein
MKSLENMRELLEFYEYELGNYMKSGSLKCYKEIVSKLTLMDRYRKDFFLEIRELKKINLKREKEIRKEHFIITAIRVRNEDAYI